MAKLVWDADGERLYEVGVSKGILFPISGGAYQKGVAWNGLTAVNEKPSGGEPSKLYADNGVYIVLMSTEEYGYGIECYRTPEDFDACDGCASIADGITIRQQERKPFGFCYRTEIGNDTDGMSHGYVIHIAYNGLATPTEKSYSTVNNDPDVETLSYDVTCTPIETGITGMKTTCIIEIDSTKVPSAKMALIEEALYGTNSTEPRILMPADIVEIINGADIPSVTLDKHYVSITTTGSATLTATTVPTDAEVTWSSASTSVATVSDGVITPAGAGNTIVTATITSDGVTYNDTCTVVVTSAT